jgi:WD40 repeat protein
MSCVGRDGRRVLSGGQDSSVRLWNIKTGQQLCRFDNLRGEMMAVALAPDGRHALSGTGGDRLAKSDMLVQLWRLPGAGAPAEK